MLSRLRPRKLSCAAVTRIVLAGLLWLALLSGVVPSGVLSSSAEQTCTMSCCAGKPPHMAGSCGAAFSAEHTESPADSGNAHRDHAGGMPSQGSSTEIVEAASHCGTHDGAQKTRHEEPSPTASESDKSEVIVRAHVLTKPCSPECAAAASAFAQVRRGHETATQAESERPFSHSCVWPTRHITDLQKPSAAQGRQSRPRAPPLFSEHLPA